MQPMENQTRTSHVQFPTSSTVVAVIAFEPHYSPKQLGEMWGLSPDFIRNQFVDEPGVLKIDRREKLHKRAYCTLRIPRPVAHKVHQRLQAK